MIPRVKITTKKSSMGKMIEFYLHPPEEIKDEHATPQLIGGFANMTLLMLVDLDDEVTMKNIFNLMGGEEFEVELSLRIKERVKPVDIDKSESDNHSTYPKF